MRSTTFVYLSEGDWEMLQERSRRRIFPKNEVILEEGDHQRALYLILRGYARVERSREGAGIAIARLGPGELFGEMSFLENTGASASVIADEELEMEMIDETDVQTLLTSVPGFSSRFYHSLAVTLARRLRETSARLTQLNPSEVAQVNRFHLPRTGQITDRQIPEELAVALDEFKADMRDVEQSLRERRLSDEGAQDKVGESADRIVETLTRFTQRETTLQLGYSDLLSFRDTAQIGSGIGAYIFREVFPLLMSSATMARAYTKPRGFPEDFETMEMIDAADADGDGLLGPLLDRWFLGRSICRDRRSGRRRAAVLIRQEAERFASPGPMPVCSLACGSAGELFDLLGQTDVPAMQISCIDIDAEALAHLGGKARLLGVGKALSFIQANLLRVTEGDGAIALRPQQLTYALGLCEYLDDEQLVRLLNWSHDHLLPRAVLVLSQLVPTHPDRVLMEHLLEWKVIHRDEGQLRALISRSRFGESPMEVFQEEAGSNLILLIRKGA